MDESFPLLDVQAGHRQVSDTVERIHESFCMCWCHLMTYKPDGSTPACKSLSTFVSIYSGSWLRYLGRFSWEVTASCSSFPPCPFSSVGGAHSRAGVAEMSHCTLNQCSKSTGSCALGVEEWVQAAAILPPVLLGLNSHSLHFQQLLLNAMSTYSEVWEKEEEKNPCCTILLPISENASQHPYET